MKKVLLKILQRPQKKNCAGVSFLIKIQAGDLQLYYKETPVLVFFCKLCEILKALILEYHCMKSVQIRSFFWSVFSRIRTEYGEIRENTDQKKPRIWTLFTQWYVCERLLLRVRSLIVSFRKVSTFYCVDDCFTYTSFKFLESLNRVIF